MMDDREKLIALLTEAKYEGFKICGNHIDCNGCPAFKDGSRCTEGVTADHLIANGVTFATDKNDGGKASKQKMKGILDWVQGTAEVDWGFMCCLKQELEQLVAIASRDDAFGGKWISVAEQQPDCECIAVGDQNEMLIGFVGTDEISKTGYAAESNGELLGNVTHWMEKPAPPKGE